MTLYEEIGADTIENVITEFYVRAFADSIIGHFFFGKDRAEITRLQIDFATAMLGGPRRYKGRPLETAHENLSIRPPHFGRRQVLMAEVLKDIGVPDRPAQAWLALEDRLRPLIFKNIGQPSCSHQRPT